VAEVRAEMVANVWKVLVSEGDHVDDGDTLVILESMKMEIPILAEESGTVTKLHVAEGDVVQEDELIAEIITQVLQQARAYMQPRIEAQTTGPEMLRTYIESNLEFIRDNPNQLRAVVEIVRATFADGFSSGVGTRAGGTVSGPKSSAS